MLEVVREFIFKLMAPNRRSSRTIAKRVPGLDHKLRNNTMEYDALVVATACVANEVLNSLRCLLREQTKMDIAEVGVNRCRVCNRRRA